MTDFKIGRDEISEGVMMNDAFSEALEATGEDDPIAEVARTMGVDSEALTIVAMGRAALLIEGTAREYWQGKLAGIPSEMLSLSMVSSGYLDGFFTALHIIEQKISTGDLTERV